MKLLNGMIFGTGLGLITAASWNVAPDYSVSLYLIGALLVTTELVRLIMGRNRPRIKTPA